MWNPFFLGHSNGCVLNYYGDPGNGQGLRNGSVYPARARGFDLLNTHIWGFTSLAFFLQLDRKPLRVNSSMLVMLVTTPQRTENGSTSIERTERTEEGQTTNDSVFRLAAFVQCMPHK